MVALADVNDVSDLNECWKALEPTEEIRLLEWSAENAVNHKGRPYDHSFYPHIGAPGGPMDAFDDHRIRTIVLQWASRLGKSFFGQCATLYTADVDPAPMMFASSDKKLAIEVTKRTYKMIRKCKLGSQLKRRTRQDLIELLYCEMNVAWARSASTLADKDIKVGHANEIDKWEQESTATEADPLKLFSDRGKDFQSTRKFIYESTPTIRGKSRVEHLRIQGTNCKFHVPCPHCKEYQVLDFDQIKWQKGTDGRSTPDIARKTAYYECVECGGIIKDHHRIKMMRAGVWCPEGAKVKSKEAMDEHARRLYAKPGEKVWDGWSSARWIENEPVKDSISATYQLWFCVTNGESTIDTDDQEWRNVNEDDVDGFNIAALPLVLTNASGDQIAKQGSSGMERIGRNDFLRPGINEMTDESIVVINLANPERVFKVVLGGNRTLSVTNAKAGDRFLLNLVQDGTGSRTVTWFSTINWPGGSAPTLTPTADKSDYLEFLCTAPNTYACIHTILNLGTAEGSSEDPGGDIVAYWKLDETGLAFSGSRYDSVGDYTLNVDVSSYPGNVPGYDTGKIGNGAFFDVSNSEYLRCDVPEGSSLDFQDSDFTFAFWLKVPTIDAAQYIFNLGPSKVYAYLDSDATLRFTCSGSSATYFGTTGTVTAGSWVFVACVHDSVNDLMKVSFNAGAFETTAHSGGIGALSGSGYFNLWTVNSFGENLDGYLDEFGIWNKALSLAEITDLYNSGSGKTYPFV